MEIVSHLYALGRATNRKRNPNPNPNPNPGASDISSHVANMFFLKRNFIEKV